MNDRTLIDEYLANLDSSTIDHFRALFYEASGKQISSIQDKYESSSGANKEIIHDDGVQANMIKWLGEELILISLYHSFEIKLKEIIEYKSSLVNSEEKKLHRWDELKKHISTNVKSSSNFQNVNTLRVLVNCFKHSGDVSKELNNLDSSFGDVGDEIDADLNKLYEEYIISASDLIRKIYGDNRT